VALAAGCGSIGAGCGNGKAISVLFARGGTRVRRLDPIARHAYNHSGL
jgi:hypothetical protein